MKAATGKSAGNSLKALIGVDDIDEEYLKSRFGDLDAIAGTFWNEFRKIVQDCGIKDLAFHLTRHCSRQRRARNKCPKVALWQTQDSKAAWDWWRGLTRAEKNGIRDHYNPMATNKGTSLSGLLQELCKVSFNHKSTSFNSAGVSENHAEGQHQQDHISHHIQEIGGPPSSPTTGAQHNIRSNNALGPFGTRKSLLIRLLLETALQVLKDHTTIMNPCLNASCKPTLSQAGHQATRESCKSLHSNIRSSGACDEHHSEINGAVRGPTNTSKDVVEDHQGQPKTAMLEQLVLPSLPPRLSALREQQTPNDSIHGDRPKLMKLYAVIRPDAGSDQHPQTSAVDEGINGTAAGPIWFEIDLGTGQSSGIDNRLSPLASDATHLFA